jgi:hypothetical protein
MSETSEQGRDHGITETSEQGRNHGNVGARTESWKRRKRRNGDGDRMETKIETENMVHNTVMPRLDMEFPTSFRIPGGAATASVRSQNSAKHFQLFVWCTS